MQPVRQLVSLGHSQRCRPFSTATAQEGTHSFALPPARLRALIVLYHRSSSFITPANLSSRIDNAFTETLSRTNTATTYQSSYKGLDARVRRNREAEGTPPLLYKGIALNGFENTTWSGSQGERKAIINAALWGIQIGGRPSLETVQETSASNEKESDLLDQTVNPYL
jgi:hypothetical protein